MTIFSLPRFRHSHNHSALTNVASKSSLKKSLLYGWLGLELLGLALTFSFGPALAQKLSDHQPEYQIRYGDRLSIKFPYHAELNEPTLTVRPDGQITLTHIGDVRAAGRPRRGHRQRDDRSPKRGN